MKKTITLILVLILCVVTILGGCDSNTNNSQPNKGEPTSFNTTSTVLVDNGRSDYVIVIPANSSKAESFAAQELQYFLKESTGVELQITTDAGYSHDNTQKVLSIGNTKLLKAQTDIVVPKDAVDTQPFIYTKQNTVYMTGNANYGILNAVYKFLQYQIGFRAYATDCVVYDYFSKLELLDFSYNYEPSIEYYYPSETEVRGEENIVNGARMFRLGSVVNDGAFTMFDGPYFSGFWCHTIYLFIPSDLEFKEYDSDGNPIIDEATGKQKVKKAWNNNQPCLSDERVLNYFIESLTMKVLATTGPAMMIGMNDETGACNCESCQLAGSKYGGQGGIMTVFLNKAAQAVEKNLKEKGIERKLNLVGLFYVAYEGAPVIENADGTLSPICDEVIMYKGDLISVSACVAPMFACYTHPFGNDACEENESFTSNIKAWGMLSNGLYVYGYGNNHNNYDTFFWDNWSSLVGSLKFYNEIGLKFFYEEGGNYGYYTPFSTLRVYLKSRMCWDINLKMEDICTDFFDAYYGPASKYMSEYFWSALEQSQYIYKAGKDYHYDTYYSHGRDAFWKQTTLKNYANIMNSAMNVIENSNCSKEQKEIYTERVYREYVLVRYNEWRLYKNYLSETEYLELEKIANVATSVYNLPKV